MSPNLTRKALYELVWTKPRSQIAKELGVSDVWIGKMCRRQNVPAPPPGYWANLAAGSRRRRKYVKPPLPYSIVERIEEEHEELAGCFAGFDPNDFEQAVPPPPVIPHTLEETLARYRQLVDALPVPKATRGLHPIAQTLLKEDDRIASLSSPYSWDKPKYRSPEGKELLDGLNQLLWMWTDLGFRPSSSGYRHIAMSIDHVGSFEVLRREAVAQTAVRGTRRTAPGGFEIRFNRQSWERQSRKPDLVFLAFSRKVLREIAMIAIAKWETSHRESVTWRHERDVQARRAAIAAVEREREEARQRREAELKALEDRRRRLFEEALDGLVRSDRIRSLAAALEERFENEDSETRTSLERWKHWALAQADQVDPRLRSAEQLTAWIGRFGLG
jgi:hypothetical protein